MGAAQGWLVIAGGTTPSAHASTAIYRFDPGAADDGITMHIPVDVLARFLAGLCEDGKGAGRDRETGRQKETPVAPLPAT